MVCVPSKAHETYPYSCCGGYDCGVILDIIYLDNGDRYITIITQEGQQRAAVFPKLHPIMPTFNDGKDHACILSYGRPGCLFMGSGV